MSLFNYNVISLRSLNFKLGPVRCVSIKLQVTEDRIQAKVCSFNTDTETQYYWVAAQFAP